jgi:hypothetical protein
VDTVLRLWPVTEVSVLDKDTIVLVSIDTDGVTVSVLPVSSRDELAILSIPTERVLVVTEFVIVSVSTDD